jgi:hypothetical protein
MRMALIVVLAALSTACNTSDGSSGGTLPPSPAPVTTETFGGTVAVGGTNFHSFAVALSNGLLTVTLTAAGPPSNISMGLALGTPSNGTCTQLTNATVRTPAGSTPQLGGTVNAGPYCVVIFDVGNQTSPVTYSLTVTHY